MCVLGKRISFTSGIDSPQAVAILRQKPSELSAKEFTDRLSLQFIQLQTNWKSKAEQLERELLRTRQDLVKCQIDSEISATSQLFPNDPLIESYPPFAPAPTAGVANLNLNPLTTASTTNINPLCSQRPPRFPLSQIQIENHHRSQLYDSLSSQESDYEWQSSGYSSSFPVQKENKRKRLVMSNEGVEQERCKSNVDGSESCLMRRGDEEIMTEHKEELGCVCEGGVVGGSSLQERITTHIRFCTSGVCVCVCVYVCVCVCVCVCVPLFR